MKSVFNINKVIYLIPLGGIFLHLVNIFLLHNVSVSIFAITFVMSMTPPMYFWLREKYNLYNKELKVNTLISLFVGFLSSFLIFLV